MLIILEEWDPGRDIKLTPSPELIPATASFPPNPLVPSEASPVVHCILLSAYKNIAKVSFISLARIH